jgi:hypothetical protein
LCYTFSAMKQLAIFVALLCILAVNIAAQPNNSSPKAENKSIANAKSSPVFNDNQESATNAEKASDDPPNWCAALKRPEWWLVIIAAFTGMVIAWQAMEMAKATKAMEASTEATEKSVTLLDKQSILMINAQRAWIMVDIEWQQGAHIHESSVDGVENTGISVIFLCRNEGQSFGQITEQGYVLKIVDLPLPKEPDFSNIEILRYSTEHIAANTPGEPYHIGDICNGRRQLNNMMVLYGRVKYRSVYGEHETRFGYTITGIGNLERLPLSSYPKYNEHA